jgi:hypothetical protein
MACQLVDSELAPTREFWREKLGLPADVIADPRPLTEIVAALAATRADASMRAIDGLEAEIRGRS